MNENLEIFEKYLAGELSDNERTALENRLKEESQLQEEFRLYRTSLSYLEAASDLRLKEKLDAKGESRYDEDKEMSRTERPVWVQYAVAASVSLLLILSVAYVYNSYWRQYSTESLYITYYETLPADNFSFRDTTGDSLEKVWNGAILLYDRGEYSEAIATLEELSQSVDFNKQSPAALYAGISYLELNDPEKAMEAFQKIENNDLVIARANWYSGLALLRLGRIEEAKEILLEISKLTNHPNQEQASELLDKMSRLAD